MATSKTGTATDPKPAATAPAGTEAPQAEPVQDSAAIQKQLTELQGKLSEYESLTERITKERNQAVADRLQYEVQYRGLQSQTTRTLQNAAKDKKDLEQSLKDRAELSAIKEQIANQTTVLEILANRVLDEEEQKDLKLAQRELKLKLAEQAQLEAKNAPARDAESAAAPTQEAAPEFNKAQFVEYYFPGVEVDPNDPRIDWATDETVPQEAFRRFTTSMFTIKDEIDRTKAQDVVAQLKAQSEEALAALEAKNQELASQNAAEIERVKTEAAEKTRKDTEKRLRNLGADVEGTPSSEGGRRTLAQQLIEDLDDRLLTTKEGAKEYNRRLEAIKKQAR